MKALQPEKNRMYFLPITNSCDHGTTSLFMLTSCSIASVILVYIITVKMKEDKACLAWGSAQSKHSINI